MWVKQCHKPLMTGSGKFIPPIKMVMIGRWCKLHGFTTLLQTEWQHVATLPNICKHISLA